MKKILLVLFCLPLFCVDSLAQAPSTFDIATFQPPTGWQRQDKPGVVIFVTSNEQKGTYAMITLFASGTSSGSAKSDFDDDWAEFIAGQMAVKGKPETEPAAKADGWDVVTGGTAFENEMGPAAVLLSTYSGFGKTFSAAAVFNSQDHLPAIEAFAASIKLKKTAVAASQPAVSNGDNASLVGQWGISVSPQDSYSVNNGINGYTTRQYTFHQNGTYEFLIKLFAYTSTQLLFTKETGTYELSGSNLTLSPQKGSIQAWTKAMVTGADGRPAQTDKFGKLVNSQAWPLEKITYRISREYMSGIDKWQLRMQSASPTRRDGPFTGNSAWPNTYFYETMRFPIDPPR